MKKITTIIIFLLQAIILSAKIGDNIQVDRIWYTITMDATDDEFGKVKVGQIETLSNGHSYGSMNKEGKLEIPQLIEYGKYKYIVEAIGGFAFNGSKDLVNVYLPLTIHTIERNAFSNCPSLVGINLDRVTNIGNEAFSNCSSLVGINLDRVINIGSEAFYNCINLRDISFCKDEQVNIGYSAFRNCTSLKDLMFNNVKLGGTCFMDCINLEKVEFCGYVDLKNSDGVFNGCNSLYTISTSPLGVRFGARSFSRIPSIKYFYYPSTDTYYIEENSLHSETFYNSNPNATLFVAEGMADAFKNHSIWSKAFKYIVTLTPCNGEIFGSTINIEDKTINVELEVVDAKSGLVQIISAENFPEESLTIPSIINFDKFKFGLTGIHDNVFKGCGIKTLAISEGVKSIGKESFAQCVNLESIVIPKSVNVISSSFIGCKQIKDVTVSWFDPYKISVDETNFIDISEDAVLNIPAGTLEKYQSHPVWKNFPNIIESSPMAIDNISILTDGEALLPIRLRNEDNIAGIQFKLTIPQGLYLDENDITSSLTERTNEMFILGHKDPDSLNTYNFIMVSLKNKGIPSGNGEILKLKLHNHGMQVGDYKIAANDIFTTTSMFNIANLQPSISEINVKKLLLGDLDDNGRVAVNDVVRAINYIIGDTPEGFVFAVADMNGDNQILVNDVVCIINTVLGINDLNQAPRLQVAVMETLSVDGKPTSFGTQLVMKLSNASSYTAMQFDMNIPSSVSINDISIASESNHHVVFREIGNGVVRVVVTSLTNEPFSNGNTLNVTVNAREATDISISNAFASTPTGKLVDIANTTIMFSQTTGVVCVDGDMPPNDIYDISGRLIKKNAISTKDIRKGVYLIKGKKCVVK